ncbi:hypothetical protein [Pontibacter akesuensis]|uniref:Uncharacterized protein n=1 Tax=Pontibacter akesuensis TaxID=388950 RepID=A0A1I7JM00_9BACT|nr:hypothetical protein [Pontibacter akesuensis]GHA69020.1 hypothetical protein GCM10007389_22590 [Pontibacter akesuensis]SFU86181.1 hypothetical protein SAMN04487941_3015 [Pontibacter akesuensis]
MKDDFDYDDDLAFNDDEDEDEDDFGMTFEEDLYLMIREKLRDTIQEYKGEYPALKKLESAVSSFKVNVKNTDDAKFYPLAAKLLSEHIKPLTQDSEEIQEIYDNMQSDITRFKNQRAHGYEGELYLTA